MSDKLKKFVVELSRYESLEHPSNDYNPCYGYYLSGSSFFHEDKSSSKVVDKLLEVQKDNPDHHVMDYFIEARREPIKSKGRYCRIKHGKFCGIDAMRVVSEDVLNVLESHGDKMEKETELEYSEDYETINELIVLMQHDPPQTQDDIHTQS